MAMPHAFPFRLIDRTDDQGGSRILLTQNAALSRGGGDYPLLLTLEALAQARANIPSGFETGAGGVPSASASASPPGPSGSEGPRLAGIDEVVFAEELQERPLRAGDCLDAELELIGAFGKLEKVSGRLRREGRTVVEAVLLLSGP